MNMCTWFTCPFSLHHNVVGLPAVLFCLKIVVMVCVPVCLSLQLLQMIHIYHACYRTTTDVSPNFSVLIALEVVS